MHVYVRSVNVSGTGGSNLILATYEDKIWTQGMVYMERINTARGRKLTWPSLLFQGGSNWETCPEVFMPPKIPSSRITVGIYHRRQLCRQHRVDLAMEGHAKRHSEATKGTDTNQERCESHLLLFDSLQERSTRNW